MVYQSRNLTPEEQELMDCLSKHEQYWSFLNARSKSKKAEKLKAKLYQWEDLAEMRLTGNT